MSNKKSFSPYGVLYVNCYKGVGFAYATKKEADRCRAPGGVVAKYELSKRKKKVDLGFELR